MLEGQCKVSNIKFTMKKNVNKEKRLRLIRRTLTWESGSRKKACFWRENLPLQICNVA